MTQNFIYSIEYYNNNNILESQTIQWCHNMISLDEAQVFYLPNAEVVFVSSASSTDR